MTTHQGVRAPDRRLSLHAMLLWTVAAGAAGAVVVAAFSPFSAATAAFSPPLYALLAGAYSFFPFLVRRVLGYPWAATAAGVVAGALSAPLSPIGVLVLVPFVAGGAAYDTVLWAVARIRRGQRTPAWAYAVAAVASALVLLVVSLPLLSPVHQLPFALAAVFAGRVAGQLTASGLAGVAGRRLLRAGTDR
ncbi:hypothetical protein ABCS02_11990 [Microbacterium sp. X-17]|uniref:hypothetical protein n=1 Tax=Microbacterium sp. X-17 TaxID=3144404 RepID=UPI0031F521D7